MLVERLPELACVRAVCVAEVPQRLPALPTTALHGALGAELATVGLDLFDGVTHRVPRLGVTDGAPAALTLASESFEPRGRSLDLRKGDLVAFRLTLIGAEAIACRDRVTACLRAALRRGLGVALDRRAPRPTLTLVELADVPIAPLDPPPAAARLRWLSPARILRDGKLTLDAETLWSSVVRRADTLSRLYGGGPITDSHLPCAMELQRHDVEVVHVRRYSSRQERRIEWPALLGSVRLSGAGLATTWPLWRFAEQVQLGKSTTFGLGRFALLPEVR